MKTLPACLLPLCLLLPACGEDDAPQDPQPTAAPAAALVGTWKMTGGRTVLHTPSTNQTTVSAIAVTAPPLTDEFTAGGQYTRTIPQSTGPAAVVRYPYTATDTTFTLALSSGPRKYSTPTRTATRLVAVFRELSGNTRVTQVYEFSR